MHFTFELALKAQRKPSGGITMTLSRDRIQMITDTQKCGHIVRRRGGILLLDMN